MATAEDIAAILSQNQQLIKLLSERLPAENSKKADDKHRHSTEFLIESLATNITEFSYDPESNVIFETWYRRYEDLFIVDGEKLDDAAKVRLLLRKLNTPAHERYVNHILPSHPRDFPFADTVTKLTKIFGRQESIFNTRYKCMNISKSEVEDFVTFAGRINREAERFELAKLTASQFKCLLFVSGLESSTDSDVRTRLLSQLSSDKGPDLTLEKLLEECTRLSNIKLDTALIESNSHSQQSVRAVKEQAKQHSKANSDLRRPRTPCWMCGSMHYAADCTYKQHKCNDCSKISHKEGYCPLPTKSSSSSSSNRASSSKRFSKSHSHNKNQSSTSRTVSSVNLIDAPSKRKYITVLINKQPVTLQFDSASDITLISQQTWQRLGNPATDQRRR